MSKDTAARTRSRVAGREKTDGKPKDGAKASGREKASGKARGNGKAAVAATAATVRGTAREAAAGARGDGANGAGGGLKRAAIERFDQVFVGEPRNRLALNAVTAGKIQVVARNREAVVRSGERTFSHLIKTPDITNQKQSGRCWMFAGLNVLRVEAMKRLKLDQFELSQTYLQFYDKLEKANWFLETMIATADEPTEGRLISFLLEDPIQDGGQWDMFADLVRKYGVVPKSVMPEAESSGESAPMNGVLRTKLREYAAELRRRKAGGAAAGALRRRKDAMLETIYRMLAIHLGRPPRAFEWQWRDSGDEFHRDGELTPHEFYERYVGLDLDDFVSLINCPTPDKPFGRLYTVQYLGNVVGGTPVRYVNVDIDAFKKAAVAQIAAGEPVWFGCDVGKMSSASRAPSTARSTTSSCSTRRASRPTRPSASSTATAS